MLLLCYAVLTVARSTGKRTKSPWGARGLFYRIPDSCFPTPTPSRRTSQLLRTARVLPLRFSYLTRITRSVRIAVSSRTALNSATPQRERPCPFTHGKPTAASHDPLYLCPEDHSSKIWVSLLQPPAPPSLPSACCPCCQGRLSVPISWIFSSRTPCLIIPCPRDRKNPLLEHLCRHDASMAFTPLYPPAKMVPCSQP